MANDPNGVYNVEWVSLGRVSTEPEEAHPVGAACAINHQGLLDSRAAGDHGLDSEGAQSNVHVLINAEARTRETDGARAWSPRKLACPCPLWKAEQPDLIPGAGGEPPIPRRPPVVFYLVVAVIVMVGSPFCGILALVLAIRARKACMQGNQNLAFRYNTYSLVASTVGVVFIILGIILGYTLLALNWHGVMAPPTITVGTTFPTIPTEAIEDIKYSHMNFDMLLENANNTLLPLRGYLASSEQKLADEVQLKKSTSVPKAPLKPVVEDKDPFDYGTFSPTGVKGESSEQLLAGGPQQKQSTPLPLKPVLEEKDPLDYDYPFGIREEAEGNLHDLVNLDPPSAVGVL